MRACRGSASFCSSRQLSLCCTLILPSSACRLQPFHASSAAQSTRSSANAKKHSEQPEYDMDPAAAPDYTTWTTSQLIARVASLEHQLRIQTAAHSNSLHLQQSLAQLENRLDQHKISSFGPSTRSLPVSKDTRELSSSSTPDLIGKPQLPTHREFDPSKYNTRFIAIKLAYFGRNYNGYEWHSNNPTPLPTVEEELWKALTKTKLIFPEDGAPNGEVNWRGTDYSKCGRTDKGVSAFGQVIGIRVRSARPKANQSSRSPNGVDAGALEELGAEGEAEFDHINDELEYPKMLNRVLPDDIRILAWCPTPPEDFSARFACTERRYKYFFTQPAFAPRSGLAGLKIQQNTRVRRNGWLDLVKMREAARLFQGSHDFRNFCKIDPSRQVTNYRRHIFYCAIEEYEGSSSMPLFVERQAFGASTRAGHQYVSNPQVYTLTVHGSAFLWHQIRCMVAVLFMVGQDLEDPSIITKLLDVEQNPSKPVYEMADDSPLVLWDCMYSDPEDGIDREDALDWVFPDEQVPSGLTRSTSDGRYGPNGINEVLWAGWRRKKIDEVLAASLIDIVAVQGWLEPAITSQDGALLDYADAIAALMQPNRVFEGGDSPRTRGVHVPLLERERMGTSDEQNAKYAAKKGVSPRDSMLRPGLR